MNSSTTSYTPAQYAGGITIDTGSSSGTGDVLNIVGLPPVPVQVQSEGPLSVYVGGGHRGMQDVAATILTIGAATAAQGKISLTLDDGGDTTARSVTLDQSNLGNLAYGTIKGLSAGTIAFNAAQTRSPLTIYGGGGGNHFIVNQAPAGLVINLNTGHMADIVDVNATGAGSVLNINGQDEADSVNVAYQQFGQGLQSVRGVINVANPLGKTKLVVDDFGDLVPRSAVLDTFAAGAQTYGSIQGLVPGVINFDAAQMSSVDVRGNGNSLTIKNTPGFVPLILGAQTFDVLATAPAQVVTLHDPSGGTADSVTFDFRSGGIGAGTKAVVDTSTLNILGSSPADAFTLGGNALGHGSVQVVYDGFSLNMLRLQHGTFTVTDDINFAEPYTLNADGSDTTVNFQVTQQQADPLITNGASMIFAKGADLFTHSVPPIDGKLELGTSEWDVNSLQSDPATQLRSLLRQGLGGKAGITSSAADATHNLGFVDSFDGSVIAPAARTVKIKYTLYGDLNLDGKVDFTDLVLAAQNYGSTNANWDQGDMNYDGQVNFSDLLKLAQNYGKRTGA